MKKKIFFLTLVFLLLCVAQVNAEQSDLKKSEVFRARSIRSYEWDAAFQEDQICFVVRKAYLGGAFTMSKLYAFDVHTKKTRLLKAMPGYYTRCGFYEDQLLLLEVTYLHPLIQTYPTEAVLKAYSFPHLDEHVMREFSYDYVKRVNGQAVDVLNTGNAIYEMIVEDINTHRGTINRIYPSSIIPVAEQIRDRAVVYDSFILLESIDSYEELRILADDQIYSWNPGGRWRARTNAVLKDGVMYHTTETGFYAYDLTRKESALLWAFKDQSVSYMDRYFFMEGSCAYFTDDDPRKVIELNVETNTTQYYLIEFDVGDPRSFIVINKWIYDYSNDDQTVFYDELVG